MGREFKKTERGKDIKARCEKDYGKSRMARTEKLLLTAKSGPWPSKQNILMCF